MVKGRKGRKEGNEGSIQGCNINRFGRKGPDLSTYGLDWLSCSPRGTGAFPGKQKGLTGPATPMELERLRLVGFGGASLVPRIP